MKCEFPLEKLKKTVQLTERVATKHATLPVLSCLLLDIKKTTAHIRATNLDIGIEVELPTKSDSEGVFAIPAHILSSFLSQTNSKESVVRFEASAGNILVSTTKSRATIKTLPPEDFPTIPAVSGVEKSMSPTQMFVKGFKSVWYAAAVSNIKPELSSIYIYKDAETLTFVATDSFRLAEKKVPLTKGVHVEDMLIPFKNTIEIVRVLEAVGPQVGVSSNKNLVSFQADGIHITSRIIDGTFPDYRQIIPKSHTTEVVVLKQDLVEALKMSTIFSDTFNQIHMSIDPKKKLFQVETKNNDVGENKSEIDAATTGEAIEVNFNCKYIADSFQSVDADSVALQFGGKNKPLVIRPVSADQSFLYLVMPMNR